ncbi:16085_t:CDS:2, partial [Cetraspora pellucida]
MSQQNDQQNLSPNSNSQSTTNANNNTTSDQFSNLQKSSQQIQQTTVQNQQSSPQQSQPSQTATTPQLQPATSQPSQVAVTVAVRPPAILPPKGGNTKKKSGGNKKPGGSRPKAGTAEKNDDSMLPHALSQMATDYYNQAVQLGQDTPEGQRCYKNYLDTVQALEQHQRNNQHASFSFVPPVNQITSPATTPSPNQVSRIIPTTMTSVPSPLSSQPQTMHNHQNSPQMVARPQQHMVGRGPQVEYNNLNYQLTASRVTNSTSGSSQTTYTTTRPYLRPSMMSPVPDSSTRMMINTHGHSGATGSPT